MRALVWEGPRSMQLREQALPQPAADEALIRVAYAGICGSELGAYLGHNKLRVPPLVMGHEFSGTIAALGSAAAGSLQVGDAVAINPLSGCGSCDACRRGDGHLCLKRALVGAHRAGAYAEYVTVPLRGLQPLPVGLDLRAAALAEPAAVAVRIVVLLGDVAGETILIAGAGPIGLLVLQLLRRAGAAQVFVSDLVDERLAMVTELGGIALNAGRDDVAATVRGATAGIGCAGSVDAVGATPARAACVAATRNAGTLVLSGLHEEVGPIPAADVIRRELVLRGSFAYRPADFEVAVRLLAEGALRLDPWIVEDELAAGDRWFQALIDAPGPVAKVLLRP
jgi:threonine dehydrogenase-like Zn-dependent dehydrogenase